MLLDLSEFPLIVGGDFNAVWEQSGLNEQREQRLVSALLHRWALDVSVIDTWHLINPSFNKQTWLLFNLFINIFVPI